MEWKLIRRFSLIALLVVVAGAMLVAQEAKFKIEVNPPEAQIFVDGKVWGDGPGKTINLSPGNHTITVYNYGFAAQTKEVTLQEGNNPDLNFSLEPAGERVPGPFGRIQVEDAPGDAAVFLNGTKPGYLVGHADMFNNNVIWKQELMVHAGKYEVTVMNRDRGLIWKGDIDLEAGKRVTIHTASNRISVDDWNRGSEKATWPRFTAGTASASVAVAPAKGTFSAEPTHINCGDTTNLAWKTQDAVDSTILANSQNLGELPVSGERGEQPKQTTNYQFKTVGPGGIVTAASTVDVNTVVVANLAAAPAEVRYHRMGDRVVEHTPTTLNWTSSNSHAATIDPIGTVSTNGNQDVKPVPKQTSDGPVDENYTYSLTATNVCGGSETKTANVHITGMIEPVPVVPLASVFFPTGYPTVKYPEVGLVLSQHNVLAKTADGLKKYLLYDPEAKITLTAHSDQRGGTKSNQALSERRANRVKTCLTNQGIPADKIEIVAEGEDSNLNFVTVKGLQKENPNKGKFKGTSQSTVWAYNRRVDITLHPTGENSTQFFPGTADDARLIFSSGWQSRSSIEKASETAMEPATGQAQAALTPTETAANEPQKPE